jgi:hypothetical protein
VGVLLVVGAGLLVLALIYGFRSPSYARNGDQSDTLTCGCVLHAEDNAISDAEHAFYQHERGHHAKLAVASLVGGAVTFGAGLLVRTYVRRTPSSP